ncbi:MAG: PSD1 and planctomycete cytochrome C domain-containing protein [Verrucomicrobiota bacterium]
MRFFYPTLTALTLAALPPLASAAPLTAQEAEQLFVHRVQPLFKTKCLACHGEDEAKIKGGLDLRSLKATLEGGDSLKPGLVASRPEESPLYLAATRSHSDWEAMPPKDNDKLSAEQLAYLKDWIAAGAPWPDAARSAEIAKVKNKWSAEDGIAVKTSGGLDDSWTNRKYKPEDLWAYQPLKKPAPPVAAASAAAAFANPIDAFLGAKLAKANLAPAPLADRATLIRRATYDLIGLPPTPEEISAFVADSASDDAAFAKVIDRLLASPHYGEKWGQHWLDVARYADTSGFANDFARGNAWRYRDYVVRSFNADKPYDQFVREQLAGDEIVEARTAAQGKTIPLTASDAPADSELLIATGFMRMGPWELTGMEVPKVARQKLLDDITDSVGQTFLAHPLQCARCHDHKFDPIPTKDYYSFQAIFATTQIAERAAPFLPTERIEGFEEKKYLLQREEHYKEVIKQLDQKSIIAARAWYAEKQLDPAEFEEAFAASAGKTGARNREAGYSTVRTALLRKGIPEDKVPPKMVGFTPEDYGRERVARKGLQRLRWDMDRYEPIAFSVYSGRTPELSNVSAPLRMPAGRMTAGDLEKTCILTGGDPFANGAPVTPAVLSAATNVAGMKPELAEVPDEIGGRRLALAAWITSPQNPITPRVMANRIWLWHFGQPIAGNPNNFGANGKKPTHPELLDWLAATFVEGGWSLKALHRIIMTSAAYRRSSQHPEPQIVAERDPLGQNFAVFKPRRLTAEEMRDSMLAMSGELNRVLGGIPARPEINREAAHQPRQVMGTFAEAWQASALPEQRHRRSIYTLKVRGQLDPFMEVFNSPSPDFSCEGRDASTVTPQAFALFNSEASLDRALALAARARREAASPEAALDRAFQLTFGRTPSAAEQKICREHLATMTAKQRTLTFARPEIPREILRDAVEENTGEKFSFSEPLEIAADFVPDLKMADAPPETRALADVCLVFLNSNEFAYIY